MALNLKSMKIKPVDTGLVSEVGRPAQYGYGLTLHLDDKQLKALGLRKPLPVGTVVVVEAKALVESTRESVEAKVDGDNDDDKVDVNMTLQITDMALEPEGTATDPAEILYGNS